MSLLMGMFDTIIVDAQCPYCKETKQRQVQTKDLGWNGWVFDVGDSVKHLIYDKKDKTLDCIAKCKSDKCSNICIINQNLEQIPLKYRLFVFTLCLDEDFKITEKILFYDL